MKNKKVSIISIALGVFFAAVITQAATTIGLNISTDGSITASSTTNQLVLGISPATVTITSTAPAAARTYTLPDNASASVNFVLAPVSSTSTEALFSSATAGAPAFRAIALTDLPTQTGTSSIAMSNSPTFVTPTLGVATATTINKVTITAPATSATLTLAEGSSLVTAGAFSNTLTTTAATNVTLPTTGTLATLAGTETLTNKTLTAPTMTAPVLGAASATSIVIGSASTTVTKIVAYSPTLTPAATAATIQTVEQTFTVTGLTTADKVFVNGPAPTALCAATTFRVSAADTLAVGFTVLTAVACTPAAGVYNIVAIRN